MSLFRIAACFSTSNARSLKSDKRPTAFRSLRTPFLSTANTALATSDCSVSKLVGRYFKDKKVVVE